MSATGRLLGVALVVLAVGARAALAQDSEFGIDALGTPGNQGSVRARSTGGAFAAFDPGSPLADAALADLHAPTASAMQAGSWRNDVNAAGNTWLQTTRFPVFMLGGPLSRHLVIGASFSTYLDQTYDAQTRDSTVIRGVTQPYNNSISSNGGVADVRLAAALRIGTRLAVGLGLHALTGSTLQTATRTYDDTLDYEEIVQSGIVTYDGFGASASAIFRLAPAAAVAVFARQDGKLHANAGDTLVASTDLPKTYGGAVLLTPIQGVRLAGSVEWQTWSQAGAGAFNTLGWSAGLEIGQAIPIRLGLSGGQLPFGPGSSAPTESGFSFGTGHTLAHGHGTLDFGLEYLSRNGSGLQEHVWTFLTGMTIRT